MKELEIFKNNGYEIRGMLLENEPYFVAEDVAKALGLKDGKSAIRSISKQRDGVVSKHPIIDSQNREQQANYLNEQGLYMMIMQSRKPSAIDFQLWVTGEVLPSIRKTGRYEAIQLTPMEQITATLEMANKEIEKERTKKELTEKILSTATTVFDNTHENMLIDNIGVQELCQILTSRATGVVIGRTSIYSIFRSMKLVTLNGRTPTQYASVTGYLDYRHSEHGYSIRIPENKIGKLISAIIKHLLNNYEMNEALMFPFHPELRV